MYMYTEVAMEKDDALEPESPGRFSNPPAIIAGLSDKKEEERGVNSVNKVAAMDVA